MMMNMNNVEHVSDGGRRDCDGDGGGDDGVDEWL